MNDKQRKEFEAWARSKNYNTSIFDDGTYVFADIQAMADAWLAARRSQDEQVRDVIEGVNDLCKDVVNAEKAQCGEHYNGWLGDAYDKAVTLQSLAQLKETTDE